MSADQPIAEGSYAWYQAELERLRAWDGLIELLDEHWPEDIFPTEPDRESRDAGPRIVSLLRWVDQLRAEVTRLREQLAAFAPPAGTAHPYCAFCHIAVDEHPGELCSPGIVRDLRRELAAYRAAAQSTDLESANGELLARAEAAEKRRDQAENRSYLFRLQAADEHHRAEQAVTERDTAQAAITRMREAIQALLTAQGRMLDDWVEANDARRRELWRHLHQTADDVRAALTPPSAPESQEAARHIGGNANAEDCRACSGTNPPYPFICPGEETDHG